jgi:hypothetical protein
MKSAFEQIRVLLELKEKGSISEEEFKQMLAILENESAKEAPITEHHNEVKEQNPVEDYQESVQKMEQVLLMLIHNGRIAEAQSRFEKFPFKSSIQKSIAAQLVKKEEPSDPDEQLVHELLMAWRSLNIDLALAKYKKLKNKKHALLTSDIISKLVQYDANLKQMRQEEEDRKQAARQESIKAKKKRAMLLSFVSIIGFFAASFFLKIPAGIWDKDGDGVYNWNDVCPNEKGFTEFDGCPDQDKDGIEDSKDKCIYEPGTVICQGCPDRDGDGVTDMDDKCPNSGGVVDKNGCPTQAGVPAPVSGETATKWPINTMYYPNLKSLFGGKFIKLVGSHYEFSEQEFKGYKKITDKTQISALNKEFGLSIPGGVETKTTGTTPLPGKAIRDLQPFPPNNLMKAKMALNDLKYVSNLTASQKEDLNKKIQSIGDDYFGGVISGKYQEDKVINKELSTILKEKNVLLTTKTNPSTSTKKEFPDKAKAQSTFSNWEKETEPAKKAKFRKEFLNFKDNYYKGVTTGKYAEDGAFEKFIQKSMKKIGYFSN